MKLLELLVKKRIKWHPEALCYTQDKEGYCGPYRTKKPVMQDNGLWSTREMVVGASLPLLDIADDWQTAIVTKAQYEQACKLVDEGYTLWFGGECPVPPGTRGDIVFRNGTSRDNDDFGTWIWRHGSDSDDIIAYRPAMTMKTALEYYNECNPDHPLTEQEFLETLKGPTVTTQATIYDAHTFLEKGIQHMKDRAAQRDSAEGERSMAACVNAFNAMFGTSLTETQGWHFMALLKMARSRNKFNPDDFEDGAAYFALAGEARSHE